METKRFALSDRLIATFVLSDRGIDTSFWPALPSRLTPAEAQEYQRVRNIMLAKLAQRLGVGAVEV